QLQTVNGSTVTTLVTYSTPIRDGDRLTVTANGSNYTVMRNNTVVATASSTFNSSSTIFGLAVEEWMAVANYIICASFEHSSWKNAGGQTWSTREDPNNPFLSLTFRRQSGISRTRRTYALQFIERNQTPFQIDSYFQLTLSLPSTSTPKTWTFSFDRLR